jgi:SAM-dependent methyltransferase
MDLVAEHERTKYEQMWAFAEYRGDHATAHAEAAIHSLQMRAGGSVIDFGAGAGYASRHLLDSGLRVLAIDIAHNAMAPEIAARVPLLVGNMWDMPVDIAADWGFCCDVMEHIPTERVDDVLRFVRRSTRQSTYFNIALRADGCGRLIGEPLHLTVRSLDWWVNKITAAWAEVHVLEHRADFSTTFVASGRP